MNLDTAVARLVSQDRHLFAGNSSARSFTLRMRTLAAAAQPGRRQKAMVCPTEPRYKLSSTAGFASKILSHVPSCRVVARSSSPLGAVTPFVAGYVCQRPRLLFDDGRRFPRLPDPETQFAAAHFAASFWRTGPARFTSDGNRGWLCGTGFLNCDAALTLLRRRSRAE